MTTNNNKYKIVYVLFIGTIMMQLMQVIKRFNAIDFCYLVILIIYFCRYLLLSKE